MTEPDNGKSNDNAEERQRLTKKNNITPRPTAATLQAPSQDRPWHLLEEKTRQHLKVLVPLLAYFFASAKLEVGDWQLPGLFSKAMKS